jgi:hypothetical protein
MLGTVKVFDPSIHMLKQGSYYVKDAHPAYALRIYLHASEHKIKCILMPELHIIKKLRGLDVNLHAFLRSCRFTDDERTSFTPKLGVRV